MKKKDDRPLVSNPNSRLQSKHSIKLQSFGEHFTQRKCGYRYG